MTDYDVELARLDGCLPPPPGVNSRWCVCDDRRHTAAAPFSGPIYRYGADIDALIAFVRRRWPEAVVRLTATCADIWPTLQRFEDHPWWTPSGADGRTDAERLQAAVLAALRP